MTSIPMNQSLEDQFLHWRQDMERKQEEQARQMKELIGQAEHLRCKSDQLRAQIEKNRKDEQANDRDVQPIARNKEKGLVVPNDVDTPADDELSSRSSLSQNLLPAKNTRESIRTRSRKRPSPHHTFSDTVSGASHGVKKEAGTRQYRPGQALENPPILPSGTMPPMPPTHPAFGTTPTFYVPSTSLIRRPDDMLSSPLGQHILDYEPPH